MTPDEAAGDVLRVPLGAPTDPLRPTGRVAAEAEAASRARLAAQAGKVLRWLAVGLLAAAALAVLAFVVIALLPKPDL